MSDRDKELSELRQEVSELRHEVAALRREVDADRMLAKIVRASERQSYFNGVSPFNRLIR